MKYTNSLSGKPTIPKNVRLATDEVPKEAVAELAQIDELKRQFDISDAWLKDFVKDIEATERAKKYRRPLEPIKIVFNPPATVVYWNDDTKTVVKMDERDKQKFDYLCVAAESQDELLGIDDRLQSVIDTYTEQGVALCYMRKLFGTRGAWLRMIKEKIC